MLTQWFVYIVKCSDDSLYTGITTDIKRRVSEHNNKIGAKAVKGKLPVELVYSEEYSDRFTAAKREREIKSWKRDKKLELIKKFSLGFTPRNETTRGIVQRQNRGLQNL